MILKKSSVKSRKYSCFPLGRCKLEHNLALSDRARFARRSRATLYTSKLEGRKRKRRERKAEKKRERKEKKRKRKGKGKREKEGSEENKDIRLQFILLVSSSCVHLQIGISL